MLACALTQIYTLTEHISVQAHHFKKSAYNLEYYNTQLLTCPGNNSVELRFIFYNQLKTYKVICVLVANMTSLKIHDCLSVVLCYPDKHMVLVADSGYCLTLHMVLVADSGHCLTLHMVLVADSGYCLTLHMVLVADSGYCLTLHMVLVADSGYCLTLHMVLVADSGYCLTLHMVLVADSGYCLSLQ